MIKILIHSGQPKLSSQAIAVIFSKAGMSDDESDYYANEIVISNEFEINAPETEVVKQMVSSLQCLGVKLTCEK